MSLKIRKQIKTPAGSFFHEHGNRIASWGLGGLLFHELDNKRGRKPRFGLFFHEHGKEIASWGLVGPLFQTRFGLFFTIFEMRERVWVRVVLFFMSLKTRKRFKTRLGLFSRDSFFLTLACYNGRRKL